MYFDDDALAGYYSDECISCNAKNLPWQEQNGDDNEDEDEEVSEICGDLYQAAGKCHLHMDLDVDEGAYVRHCLGLVHYGCGCL